MVLVIAEYANPPSSPQHIAAGFHISDISRLFEALMDYVENNDHAEMFNFNMRFSDDAHQENTRVSEESIMTNLKTKVFQDCDETCAICLCDYEENEKIGVLDCGHEFHIECIKKWLLQKNICPMCRGTAISS
ncbi:hypothetical protein Leryth_024792 [Lithospermum erythrorhizon]|uniref:RING-type E3 ubiquitin transferase n=1 Tax=Lithospermum erythrorhizon TaxID=34254 RepID=A0AAV3S1I3_LITER|nr:hypothetical protein Leryth_024792 [Lithospermum erythrorhizon]